MTGLSTATPMRMFLRRYRRSHVVASSAAPSDLLHLLTVHVPLDAPLVHTLTVISGALHVSLLHILTVQNPLIALTHVLRVLPPVAVLGDDSVQKPTQQVTRTP